MTTTTDMYAALLRPAVIQILRATGFSYAKPAVIDALTDLATRYIFLLSSSTASNAYNCHNDYVPTIQDVRLALTEVGALRPQMTTSEEVARGVEEVNGELMAFEDMRGVKGFVAWAQGPVNKEIRRVAGFGDEIDVNEIAAGVDETEDYLTALKKKHSKTAEESRYQGTALGKDLDINPVSIVGSDMLSLSQWIQKQSKAGIRSIAEESETEATTGMDGVVDTPLTSVLSSAPASPGKPGSFIDSRSGEDATMTKEG